MEPQEKKTAGNAPIYTGGGLVLGAVIGLLFGMMLLQNTAFGVVIGAAVGLIIGAVVDLLRRKKQQ
jgi:uncharacterized membrane protein